MKLSKTAGVWLVVLVFALLRGGKGGGASLVGAECGDALSWSLMAANMVVLLAITVGLRWELLGRAETMRSLGHVPRKGELTWTPRASKLYPLAALLTGVLAGLLGLGGGMVIGPLLLALGGLPQPTAATSAWVVLITATSGLCQVIIYGLLPADYAALFLAIGLFSTYIGQTAVEALIRRNKQDAVVVLVIGAVMLLAMGLMGAAGVVSILGGAPTTFGSLCR